MYPPSKPASLTAGGLWTAGSDNDIVRTSLLPKLRKTQQEHEKMLYEVVTLQVSPRGCALHCFCTLFLLAWMQVCGMVGEAGLGLNARQLIYSGWHGCGGSAGCM